jgi:hypothetical protein
LHAEARIYAHAQDRNVREKRHRFALAHTIQFDFLQASPSIIFE